MFEIFKNTSNHFDDDKTAYVSFVDYMIMRYTTENVGDKY